MSDPAPVIKGSTAAQDAARAWQQVRADRSIQFEPLPVESLPNPPVEAVPAPPLQPKPPPEPSALGEWLRSVFEPIGKALGLAWPTMQWVLLAIGVAIVAYAIWRMVQPVLESRAMARLVRAEAEAAWVPEQAQAQALLDEADALADAGRFDEATHLLLKRSVEHIALARPDWVLPASTTREIAGIDALGEQARGAFGQIAHRVERSRFALRSLDQADWLAARAAYADFALTPIAARTLA